MCEKSLAFQNSSSARAWIHIPAATGIRLPILSLSAPVASCAMPHIAG